MNKSCRKINSNVVILIVTIFFICCYHYLIQNGIEKTFASTIFPYEFVKRPSESCNVDDNYGGLVSLRCVGLPSGHAETATIFSLLLWFNKIIPLWFAILFILVVSVQRVISWRHTPFQVIAGIVFGTLYSLLYAKLKLSLLSFFIVFCIGIVLTVFSLQ